MSLKLVAADICKSYNNEFVLRNCSFSFDANGIYVLTGHNGSGKSTFLKICALLETPDSGEVKYYSKNTPANDSMELRRRITLVLPRVGVFNTTVFKNAAYGLKIRGLKKEDIKKKTYAMLEFVGLAHKKNHNALTLSSGETQRLGIARAMVIDPEVLFLDEPTASVDWKNTEIIEDIIVNLKKESRSTIIVTTHDREQAERIGDFMLLMNNGSIKTL